MDARPENPAGMVKMKIAIRFATMSAMTAAMCAFTLFDAISTSSVTTGIAAAIVDSRHIAQRVCVDLRSLPFGVSSRRVAACKRSLVRVSTRQ